MRGGLARIARKRAIPSAPGAVFVSPATRSRRLVDQALPAGFGPNTIMTINPGGPVGRSSRC
jgi:hypothetical protein